MEKKVELTDDELLKQVDGGNSRYARTKDDDGDTPFVIPLVKANKQKTTKKVSR